MESSALETWGTKAGEKLALNLLWGIELDICMMEKYILRRRPGVIRQDGIKKVRFMSAGYQ